ncbi:hypothetical protein BLEM_2136 [Bifidobacterium lemurum]|uniref:Anaerobic C4-dicarboxylate transport protein n=2 Tax=Bifidobacterium lemurum TaxID=1603886 RepID=A0A261FLC5_9BIFI|nr:hypothetical protein [Bifidobacterium lemurum]OZG59961.1 hypothetical protein BLEM_2136 [Bifidobacterium lemurum]
MLMELLPAVLWCFAVVISVNLCCICVIRGKFLQGGHPPVRPVSWGIVGLHIVSVLLFILPYPVYLLICNDFDSRARDFYTRAGWPSVVVVVLCVAAQLALMYLQARRAMFTEMDERLNRAGK